MLLHHKKFICKNSKGGRRTKPTLKNPKDYGINTDPPHKAFIYSVSFWFFYPPCREKHINYFIMQNHPRISAGSQLGSCHFSQQVIHQHLQLSPFAYQRYIRRSSLARRDHWQQLETLSEGQQPAVVETASKHDQLSQKFEHHAGLTGGLTGAWREDLGAL